MTTIMLTRRLFLQALSSAFLLQISPVRAEERASGLFPIGKIPGPEQILRVVSAGAPADLLLLAAAPEKMVGFSSFDFSLRAGGIVPDKIRRLKKIGRLAGRASTLSLESLMALKPDLVIDCGYSDETWLSQARRVNAQTQIPWLLIDGTLRDSPQQLMAVGQALNTEFRTTPQAVLARQFIGEALVFSRTPAAGISFYAARGARGLETGLQGSLHTEAAELLGLRNVAKIPGRSGLALVSMENLLQWQPDIILVQDATTVQHLRQDPIWRGVNAVAQNRILFLSGLPFGWLDAPPGINRLLGLRRLHAWLDADIQRGFKEEMGRFADLFWHQPLSDAQYQQIAGGQ